GALGKHAAQFLGTFIFLPYEAYISTDAIVRTLARMLWTKKKMLEWKTSSDADRGACVTLPGFLWSLWVGPVLAVTLIALLTLFEPVMLLVAGPLLGLWFASPLVAWWLSRALAPPEVRL